MLRSLESVPFGVEVRPDRSRVVVAVRGELDMATVDGLNATVQELRTAGWEHIALDVGDVSFVDSQGIGLLLAADAAARSEGWRFALTGESPTLTRVLEVACLTSHFERE